MIPLRAPLLALLACLAGCDAPLGYQPRPVWSLLEARHEKTVVQQWDISCGAAALATVLTYEYGDAVSEREVAAGMLAHTSAERVRNRLGFSLLDLKRYAHDRGYDAQGYGELTFADLKTFGPAIVPMDVRGLSHFVVFRGVRGDRVLVSDPGFGSRTMLIGQFEAAWKGQIGFTVSRRDGAKAQNRLEPTPSDFWASSVKELERFPVFALLPAPEVPVAARRHLATSYAPPWSAMPPPSSAAAPATDTAPDAGTNAAPQHHAAASPDAAAQGSRARLVAEEADHLYDRFRQWRNHHGASRERRPTSLLSVWKEPPGGG